MAGGHRSDHVHDHEKTMSSIWDNIITESHDHKTLEVTAENLVSTFKKKKKKKKP